MSVFQCVSAQDPLLSNDIELENTEDGRKWLEVDTAIYDGKSVIEIARLLVSYRNLVSMTINKNKRNFLHTVAIAGRPNALTVTHLLLPPHESDRRLEILLTKDKNGFTPLHYSAMNGLPELTLLFLQLGGESSESLRLATDNNGQIPIHYAAVKAWNTKAKKCLEILTREAGLRGGLRDIELKTLYKAHPKYLTGLMENSFSCDKNENGCVIGSADLSAIVGYRASRDEEGTTQNPVPENDLEEDRPETFFIKEALHWTFDKQNDILTEKLMQYYITVKYHKLRPLYWFWTVIQTLWLIAYNLVAYKTCGINYINKTLALICVTFMAVYILMSAGVEVFQMVTTVKAYFFRLRNWLQILQLVLAGIVVLLFFLEPTNIQMFTRSVSAAGILLAHTIYLKDIGNLHDDILFVVELVKQVAWEVAKVSFFCISLIIGFTQAFILLYQPSDSEEDNDAWQNGSFPFPVLKIFVMMTGEMDYGDDESLKANFPSGILFLVFMISLPISFFNLLTALAVDRVMELKKKTEVLLLVQRLEKICLLDSFLHRLGFRRFDVAPNRGKLTGKKVQAVNTFDAHKKTNWNCSFPSNDREKKLYNDILMLAQGGEMQN